MKDLQNLVYKYMEQEELTLKKALLRASLGMCAKGGDVAEIVRGVVFNGYPYTEERKKQNAEHLGEILFYWIMIASTCDLNPDEIIQQYISSYLAKQKIMREEEALLEREKLLKEDDKQSASILEMLKHIKTQEEVHASMSQMRKHVKQEEKTK